MIEGASIDKQMHGMDYDRSLAELIEFDEALRAVMDWADARPEDDTLIIVTADHGQGFDACVTLKPRPFSPLKNCTPL